MSDICFIADSDYSLSPDRNRFCPGLSRFQGQDIGVFEQQINGPGRSSLS